MDESTLSLLSVLKKHFEHSASPQRAFEKVPMLTWTHLSRPAWPAYKLRASQKAMILQELVQLSRALAYGYDTQALGLFAQKAVALVLQHAPNQSHTQLEKKRLIGFIHSEQQAGHLGEQAATRAAARFLQTKRREHKQTISVPPDPKNPLLSILSLPKSVGAELPKQDIRGLILKSALADLLKKASAFSPEVLKSVLGPETSKHLKPVGFADKSKKILLIEVASSSVAYEASFQKVELLRRLRQLPDFEQLVDLKFTTNS